MSKLISITFLVSFLGTCFFVYLHYQNWIGVEVSTDLASTQKNDYAPPKDQLLAVFGQLLNATSILALISLLYWFEKTPHQSLGKMIRDQMATIMLALSMSLIFALIELYTQFAKVSG